MKFTLFKAIFEPVFSLTTSTLAFSNLTPANDTCHDFSAAFEAVSFAGLDAGAAVLSC
ncbi:hypothetical protein [Photobacterium leiognathi]|uniref:hypothetical protein n=1 Tax=Photobacterium leiognathi TaxID=553611 RepID=UPI0034E94702